MLNVVCFSRDRPLQLEAYLSSLMYFGGLKPEYIHVLYTGSSWCSYDKLIEGFPDVNWVREQSFHRDLHEILGRCESFVLLGCDDVVFKEFFDPNECIRTLQTHPDVFGFSLRLGTNLKFIPDLRQRNRVCVWCWHHAKGDHWGYPWEVSASVYRRDDILAYLDVRPDVTNPNRFEAFRAVSVRQEVDSVPRQMACFYISRCLTVTVNRVQDEYPNAFDNSKNTSPASLYRAHRDGLKQDWLKLVHWRNSSIHVGAEAFELVEEIQLPRCDYDAISGGFNVERRRKWSLKFKVLWWRMMTVVWEETRRRLPRRALVYLKRLVKGRP